MEKKSLFITPIYKDWVFYLWIFSVISILPTISANGGGVAGLIDLAFGMFIQAAFFLYAPAYLRSRIKKRKKPKSD